MSVSYATSMFALLVPYRLRRVHQFWAWLRGYFWVACPRCGRPFGGHEWRTRADGDYATVPVAREDGMHRMAICPPCTTAREEASRDQG